MSGVSGNRLGAELLQALGFGPETQAVALTIHCELYEAATVELTCLVAPGSSLATVVSRYRLVPITDEGMPS